MKDEDEVEDRVPELPEIPQLQHLAKNRPRRPKRHASSGSIGQVIQRTNRTMTNLTSDSDPDLLGPQHFGYPDPKNMLCHRYGLVWINIIQIIDYCSQNTNL